MVAKILVLFVGILAVFTTMGWLPVDTFMNIWEEAFVITVKLALFAAIPGGFLLAIYLKLQG